MSQVGKKINKFNAEAYRTNNFLTVSSDDLLGHWSILMFYPADFSYICPTELEDLQNHYAELQSLGVEVYACSTDTALAHANWHKQNPVISQIEFTMIGDPTHLLAKSFDVLNEEKGLAQRASFIIDPDGVIQAMEITANQIGRDAKELVKKIKAAQFIRNNPGHYCPASWNEGEETLFTGLDLVDKI